MKKKILLTSVGGLVAPSMIKDLRDSFNDSIEIIGVDSSSDAIGFYYTDNSFLVPYGLDKGYVDNIFDISVENGIEVIIPLSDEEVLSLSKNKKRFLNAGIRIACSDYESIRIASDKALMLDYLKEHGISTPAYYVPKNFDDLNKYSNKLGYPYKPFVFKPRNLRGARGFWKVAENINKRHSFLFDKDRKTIPLNFLLDFLNCEKEFPKILLMEYLSGKDLISMFFQKMGNLFILFLIKDCDQMLAQCKLVWFKKMEKLTNLLEKLLKFSILVIA